MYKQICDINLMRNVLAAGFTDVWLFNRISSHHTLFILEKTIHPTHQEIPKILA